MRHIMLDLETLGTKPGCAIVQISAVVFDLDGNTYEEFDKRIDIGSNMELGLTVDSSTLDWWFKQSKEVQDRVFNDKNSKVDLKYALLSFTDFIKDVRKVDASDKIRLWGNGATFDNVIIEHAFLKAGYSFPISYNEHCDVRTIVTLDDELLKMDIRYNTKFVGIKHNAIDDCKYQIKYVTNIIKEIMV